MGLKPSLTRRMNQRLKLYLYRIRRSKRVKYPISGFTYSILFYRILKRKWIVKWLIKRLLLDKTKKQRVILMIKVSKSLNLTLDILFIATILFLSWFLMEILIIISDINEIK